MKATTPRLVALVSRSRPQVVQRHIATSATLLNAPKPKQSDAPIPTPRPIFPPANNPFAAPPSPPTTSSPTTAAAVTVPSINAGVKHSPLKIAVVKALAKMMGYNTKSVTAIRETGNMVGSIVRAVERDHDFWYQGKPQVLPLLQLSADVKSVQNVRCHQHISHSSSYICSIFSFSSLDYELSRPQRHSQQRHPSHKHTRPKSSPTFSSWPKTKCA